MTIQQLSVFLENRKGRLEEALCTLCENGINIIALSLAENEDYGMMRMVVSEPAKARDVLKEAGVTAMLTDVIALRVPHAAGSLCKAMSLLVSSDVNVEYMYAFANGPDASAILKTDEPEKAVSILETGGFAVWKAEEAYAVNG